ncbi:unnamed protein product [Adineta ricciae]|uniref:Uncharacterized protein n=1 Tax=Adineta ricciae TaxID=249248 RepID=A0A815E6D3_ADIRI|nr:unnamed protein product [Adineta ricciae]
MLNDYFNWLEDQLRLIAHDVFPSDPEKCVQLSNINKYTRLYLRRIIKVANDKYNLKVTDGQLVQLLHVSRKQFSHWMYHDAYAAKVFRRARCLLRDLIIMMIYEDRGELSKEYIPQKPIDRPSNRTIADWQQRTQQIREEYQNKNLSIKNLKEAEELIDDIQAGYDSSWILCYKSDSEGDIYGESAHDETRLSNEIELEPIELLALNGDSTNQTLYLCLTYRINLPYKS